MNHDDAARIIGQARVASSLMKAIADDRELVLTVDDCRVLVGMLRLLASGAKRC
jgi:hypothetical protein